ncbi:MAG: acetate--CoA ligase [Chitinophagales bacterium]
MINHAVKSLEEYNKQYQKSIENPTEFWDEVAVSFLWKKKWDKTLEWDFKKPSVKWFQGGKLNITENCIDRHLTSRGEKTAIIWEPNSLNEAAEHISYNELHQRVCKFANSLKKLGVKKGDRVCIYLPMIPELAVAMLACARIGAIHSIVFAGFSSTAIAARINDANCSLVITADGSYRGNKIIDLKGIVDVSLNDCDSVKNVVVVKRTNASIQMENERDVWWHDIYNDASADCLAETMNAEDELFILYTSGSTGTPKGMVHTTGGYMVYTAYTFQNIFQYQENDVYWCTADIGWITGHSYIIYGPLACGAATIMFEGVPSYPDYSRFWEIVEKHKVNQFYTAPTAIRALAKHPTSLVEKHDLSSLKVIGSVGEPINEEAWHWYDENIGKGNCSIVDTWWQTETGGVLISPFGFMQDTKPTFAMLPQPGIQPCLMDENGKEINETKAEGRLAIKYPWPSMARTIWGNHERYKNTYFSTFEGKYFTGDGSLRDEEGNYRITGRVDDIIIVSGHNLGTAPIENIINEHEQVVESAIVGFPHDVKGNALYAYVICYQNPEDESTLSQEINALIAEKIGPIAKCDKIQFVTGLPKTRSGKIMRRILRKIAEGRLEEFGDISTLLDPSVVEDIVKNRK